jgi:hypothetical protein
MRNAHEILVARNVQQTDHVIAWRRGEVDVRIHVEKRNLQEFMDYIQVARNSYRCGTL